MSEKFTPVSIAFACNDEYGNFNGVAEAIEIGECLRLEQWEINPRSPSLKFKIEKYLSGGGFAANKIEGLVKISKRWFPIVGYKSAWGNIIWDLVIVAPETAKQITEYLKELKIFSTESGFENWIDEFESEKAWKWTPEHDEDLEKYGYQRP
jgi:hypothetical protein